MSRTTLYFFTALLTFLVLPQTSLAAVTISEVAWMGTGVDNGSFCEWIELANTGTESESLSGWTLKTLDGGMSVPLSGSIDASAFYLIERSTPTACPDPVPGIDADLTRSFGSGLSNSGEILILSSKDGEVERIDASTGWEKAIGGDSEHKYSAQRNGASWVTNVPTPKAVNATESVVTEEASSTSPTKSTSSAKKSTANPVPTLYMDVGTDRTVSTKTHVRYRAVVWNSEGKLVYHPRVSWAFGDGDRQVGMEADHVYRVPGEYLVVLHAQDGYSSGNTSFVVTADSAAITITDLVPEGIALTNEDTRTLDLSRYELSSDGKRFRIPEDTHILPGRTVIFPHEITGISATSTRATLAYPSGEVISLFDTASTMPPVQPPSPEPGTILMNKVDIKEPNQPDTEHEPEAVTAPA